MRDNSRVKERFELALDARQVAVIVLGSLVIVGGVFVLGVTAGRQGASAPAPVVIAAPKDPLARLDDPLPAPAREEPPPELKAHQALTDGRAIEQALPVAPAKPVAATTAAPAATAAAVSPAPSAADTAPVTADVSWTRPASAPPPEKLATAPARPAASAPPVKPAVTKPAASAPSRSTLAKATPPRPTEAPAKKGSYTIQVGSSPNRGDADRLAKKLAARSPRVVVADVPGKGRWYRVQIGTFESQDAARKQLSTLSREGVQGIVTAR